MPKANELLHDTRFVSPHGLKAVALWGCAIVAVAALAARRADGAGFLPGWLELLLQLPAIALWLRRCWRNARRGGPGSARTDLFFTAIVLTAAVALAVVRRDLAAFFAATTVFVAGALASEGLARLYARAEAAIDQPRAILRLLVGPWAALLFAATVLLSLPLATQSSVPDYQYNFWDHVLNCAHDAVSAGCLVGTTIYGMGEEYSLFGQAVLVAVTQLAGMGFAAVGLAVFRPFMRSRLRLRTVLLIALLLQLAGIAVMSRSWHEADAASLGARLWWGLVHAAGALWNAGLVMKANGISEYLNDGAVFATLTTLAIIGALGVPVVADLLRRQSTAPPESASQRPIARLLANSAPTPKAAPWQSLPAWEAGAAFVLLIAAAALLFWFETPWGLQMPWRLPENWIPPRPVDLGEGRIALRDDMGPAARWTTAVFVSATLRSAGLQSVPVSEGAISWPSYGLLLAWMLIGGSTAGVAGGMRTSCLLVPAVCLFSRRRTWEAAPGGAAVRRSLAGRALVFGGVWLLMSAIGAGALASTTDGTGYELVFESVAALNSVGLTTGLSLHLTWAGRLVMIVLMIAGRVVPAAFWCAMAASLVGRVPPDTQDGG